MFVVSDDRFRDAGGGVPYGEIRSFHRLDRCGAKMTGFGCGAIPGVQTFSGCMPL